MPGTSKATNPRGYTIEFDEASHTYHTKLTRGMITATGAVVRGGAEPFAGVGKVAPTEDPNELFGKVYYVSGTKVIHHFFPPFDPDGKITANKAKKLNITVDELKFQWKQKSAAACAMGTRVHETCEDVLHGRRDLLGKWDFRNKPQSIHEQKLMAAGFAAAQKVLQTMEVVGIEQIVFDLDCQIAGTIDLLCRDKSDSNLWWVLDWKGLALDTPIFTTDGWKTMGTVACGDYVYDRDGNQTRVIHTSEVHHNPCYKLKFDNGDEIVADHEHRWLIAFNRGKDKHIERVMTTEEIAAHLKYYDGRRSTYNIPRILNPRSLCGADASLLIDPYVLGVWLGDGSAACGIISNPNEEIFDEIRRRGYKVGDDVSGGNGHCPMRTVYGLATGLRKLDLLNRKDIPHEYMMASKAHRLDLLRGFMDADGYYNKIRKQFSTDTTRRVQRDFVCALLASLGVKYSVFKVVKDCNGKKFAAWSICFTSDFNPFLVRNQDIDFAKVHTSHTFRNVISCEKVPSVATRCIEVDSPTHTFLAGKQMIVTHNTNEKIEFHNRFGVHGLFPIEHLEDCNGTHYALQLSLYEFLLRIGKYIPHGAKVRRGIFHLTDDGPRFYELPDLSIEVRDMVIAMLEQPPF